MLIIKVDKTFGINILSYIKDLFKNEKINIINDSKTLELIASDLSEISEDSTTIELTFKKIITINNPSTMDSHGLDRIVSEVKNFCDQAVKINNYIYLPLNMREKKDANTRTIITRNRI